MDKKNKKEHPRVNRSRVSRYATITIFLIFAFIAFYTTIERQKNEVQLEDKNPVIHTKLSSKAEEKKSNKIQAVTYNFSELSLWDKIVVNYFSGKDVYNDLTKMEVLSEKDSTLNTEISQLKKLVQKVRVYKPVDIYLETKSRLDKIEQQQQEIKCQGEVGKILQNFVQVHDKNINVEFSERVEDIIFHVKEQNYDSATASLLHMQSECGCIKMKEFAPLLDQKKIFSLIEKITKAIYSEKKEKK